MFEIILNKLSTHALFSIFFAAVMGVLMIVLALVSDLSMAAIPALTFVIGACVYLILDFYETFGED